MLENSQIGDASSVKVKEERIKSESDAKSAADAREKVAPKAAIVERIIQEEQDALKEKQKEMADKPKISKKKLRVMSQPTIAELKAVCFMLLI